MCFPIYRENNRELLGDERYLEQSPPPPCASAVSYEGVYLEFRIAHECLR